nr:reverse transcriptase domain-containing protein [Tanacetum cinerariifolium]
MPEHQSDILVIFTVMMKILLEPTSSKLLSKIKILDHKHAEGTAKNSQDKKVLRLEAPTKAERSKVIEFLSKAASFKEVQLKKAIKRSKTNIHQGGGSSEGANLESKVPDGPKDSSKSEYESWGDSDDDNNDDDQQSHDENKSISMRNRIFMHTVRDDSTLGTLRFVSKSDEYQVYGALPPEGMTNEKMQDYPAYKTYLAFATGAATLKKARKFKKVAFPSKIKLLLLLKNLQRNLSRYLLLEDSLLVYKSETLLSRTPSSGIQSPGISGFRAYILATNTVDSPPEATVMTKWIRAMLRLNASVNGFVNWNLSLMTCMTIGQTAWQQIQFFNEHEDTDYGYDNLFARRNHRQHHTPHRQRTPHQRQPQHQVDPLRSLGLRIEIPEFEGKLQPDDFLDWIQTVERIFDLRDIPTV